MTKIFYDHLTVIEEVTTELDNYRITKIEKDEIVQLIGENIHTRVLHVILEKLPKEKHGTFLSKFHQAPHDKTLLDYLKTNVADIEKLITAEAKKVKEEILSEIKKAKL